MNLAAASSGKIVTAGGTTLGIEGATLVGCCGYGGGSRNGIAGASSRTGGPQRPVVS